MPNEHPKPQSTEPAAAREGGDLIRMLPAQQLASPRAPWVAVIRQLGERHRARIARHLQALDEQDRYLRFGYAANNDQIQAYVDTLNKLVPLLIAKGQTYRPTLGFLTLANWQTLPLGLPKGALVGEVDPGGLAEAAGLRGVRVKPGAVAPYKNEDFILGDLITGLNGVAIETDIQLMDLLELLPPDATLSFDVLRDGKPAKVVLKPGDAPRKAEGTEQKI